MLFAKISTAAYRITIKKTEAPNNSVSFCQNIAKIAAGRLNYWPTTRLKLKLASANKNLYMKKIYSRKISQVTVLLAFCVFATHLFAQKNLELVSRLTYNSLANDIWHYTSPGGTDYVLMGLRSGVSIVSLADPANPVEIQFIPGEQSVWRDLKFWGEYAYVTADQPGTKEGLLVIDLSGAPDQVDWYNWRPVLPGQTDTLFNCHNIWIDEFGYAYLSGCNINQGGVIFIDVFSEPGTPKFAGYNDPVYAHDCYALNNRLYTAEIYEGQFAIYDVADKNDTELLATQQTPFEFCHNVWTTADAKTIFTTDERANAPTAAYDISDLDNIRLLDEFRPPATLGLGVIPHNAHVIDNFVVISHYTDGCIIVDATRPDNLVQIAQYDTSSDFVNGFHGDWGADPFLSSGLIAVSDIENGLFILKPTYQRAAYLEGKITDAVTGSPITGAIVVIQSPDANYNESNISGVYKTGQVTPGTFEVLFRAKGYFDATAQATLVNGEVTLLDITMTPLPPHVIGGSIVDAVTGKPLEGAEILIENHNFSYSATSDANGNFQLPAVLEGDYTVFAGRWGYENLTDTTPFTGNTELNYALSPAYEDNFNVDLGWTVTGNAKKGIWERGMPKGLFASGIQWRPAGDSPFDPGNRAYITGNQGNTIFDDQVDEGETTLTSPAMQLRRIYNRPLLAFDYWFYNAISNNAANDSLVVLLNNGKTSVVLDILTTNLDNVQSWTRADTFDLADLIEITDDMRISFTVSDRAATPNVVEAGIDNFRIWESLPDEGYTLDEDAVKIRAFPNPFLSTFTIDYRIDKAYDRARLLMFNTLGQQVQQSELTGSLGRLQVVTDLAPGVYFVAILTDENLSKTVKVVKGK